MTMAPVSLEQHLAERNDFFESWYTNVFVTGRFSGKEPLRLLDTHMGGPAWRLVDGFVTESGHQLLVIRGKQPETAQPPPRVDGE